MSFSSILALPPFDTGSDPKAVVEDERFSPYCSRVPPAPETGGAPLEELCIKFKLVPLLFVDLYRLSLAPRKGTVAGDALALGEWEELSPPLV